MRFGLSAKAVADVGEVKSSLIRTRRIVFTPTVALKEELANTSIQITCYDRNGEIVKRVTSTDPGEVEEPDTTDDNGTNGTTTDDTGGGSTTGDDNNDGPSGNTGDNSGDDDDEGPSGNTGDNSGD